MKKLSILTAVAAISCVTLIVACGQNRNQYNGRGGGGYCPARGYDQYARQGYDRYDRQGYDRQGHARYDRQGYDRYDRRGGYDPTCTGGIHSYPTGYPHEGCGYYGQGYRSARHYTHGGNWCVQGGFDFCIGTRGYCPYRSVGSGETEIILCNLNEEPHAACPQGLTCQEIGEGDTGICS